MFTNKNVIILIFLAAFSVRLISIFNYNLPLHGDEPGYNELGVSLFSEHKYYLPSALYSKPPGYPFFISIVYFLFGHNITAVRIVQALFDSMLCVFIYLLCYKMFNRPIALIATIFSISYLLFIKSVSRLNTESIFTFMFFLTIFYIFKSRERFSYFSAVIIGLLMTILTLTKGIFLLFLPFLLIILLVSRYYRSINLKKATVAILAFIIFMTPWTYRNYKVYNAFLPISTQGGFAFFTSYFPLNGKVFGACDTNDIINYAVTLESQTERGDYLFKKTIEFIRNNPFKVLRLQLLKILYFWCPFDWETMGVKSGVYNFQYVFMLPFSIFGALLLLRHFNKYLLLYIPIIYLFSMCLVFYGSPRFRMPIEPYMIIFFAVGIFEFYKKYKKKYIPFCLIASYAFFNFFAYLNSHLVKLFLREGFRSIGLW